MERLIDPPHLPIWLHHRRAYHLHRPMRQKNGDIESEKRKRIGFCLVFNPSMEFLGFSLATNRHL